MRCLQKTTREQALKSSTLTPASGAFEENIKGSLTVGKLADLVVFDQDILETPEEEILKTQVVMTVIGGEIVYEVKKIRFTKKNEMDAIKTYRSKYSSPVITGISCVSSFEVNNRDRIINLMPIGISIEKLLPLPGTTSRVNWVCFQ